MPHKKSGSKIAILIINDKNGRSFSLRLSTRLLKLLIAILFLLAVTFVGYLVYYGRIAGHFLLIKKIMEENRTLKQRNQRIVDLEREINKIKKQEEKIRTLAVDYYLTPEKTTHAATKEPKRAETSYLDTLVSEAEIEEFVNAVRLQRNLSFINNKNTEWKRRKIKEAIPNIMPVNGWITRGFNEKSCSQEEHLGIDIAAAKGTLIKATAPGIVVFAGCKQYFGNYMEIDHGHGFITRYGHCDRLMVKKGDLISRGQIVALVGSSGRSSAPHLHYELLKDGKSIDPVIFMLN